MGSSRRKRQRAAQEGGEAGQAATAAPSPIVHLRRTVEPTTVKAALSGALEGLDAIAHDAHVYSVQQQQQQAASEAGVPGTAGPTGWQSNVDLKADVFAAMAAPHYETLRTCVVSCGLQLLPVLDSLTRRVGLALATPVLSVSVEAWELAALLCQYYRAGAVRLVDQLAEMLLRESGVFLLDAPYLVPSSLAERVVRPAQAVTTSAVKGSAEAVATPAALTHDGTSVPSVIQARRAWLGKVQRKWAALSAMLQAVGPLLPRGLLARVAERFALEVVDQGLLACVTQGDYLLSQATTSASAGLIKVTTTAGSGGFGASQSHVDLRTATTAASSSGAAAATLEAWTLPLEWAAVCVHMLDGLLRVADPVVPQLLATADRLVEALTASLHAGGLAGSVVTPGASSSPPSEDVAMPSASLYADLVAATVQLQGTLRLLRNPLVMPMFVLPVVTTERPKRRVQLAAVATSSSPADDDAAAAAAMKNKEEEGEMKTAASRAVAASDYAATVAPAKPVEGTLKTQTELQPQPLPRSVPMPTRVAPPAPAPKPTAQQQPRPEPVVPVRRAVENAEEEDDDGMPDIVLDD